MNRYAHIVLTFLFILLFFDTPTFPQYDEIKFEHYTTVDGLPDLIIKCILQDHLGFIWLGTGNGLVKYDGYSMKIYRPEPGDSTSISHSVVVSLYEDKYNNLWIGTGWGDLGGLNLFDRATETFTRYMHNINDTTSINHNFITSIFEDNEARLWIGTKKGLNLLDKTNGKFQHFYFKDSASIDESNSNLLRLNEGIIYAITENLSNGDLLIGAQLPGLWKFDFKKKYIEKYLLPEGINKVNKVPITDFYQTENGIIWMGMRTGLTKFDSKSDEISFYPDPLSLVNEMEYDFNPVLQDHRGIVWKGIFRDGLIQFDPKTEKYKRYKYDKLNSGSLYGENVRSLMEDHSGIIWIGKYWYGLDKYDFKKWKFKHFSNDPRNPNSLSENWVSGIFEDRNGMLWIGSYGGGGLNQFDRQNNQFYHYRHDPDNPFSISSDSTQRIIADNLDENILWIGTRTGGLNKFDIKRGVFTHYKNNPADNNSISHNWVNTIVIDDQGILWCGTWGGGLNSFNRSTGKFTRFHNNPNDSNSISQDQIMQIYKDRAGILWISTNTEGINRLDPTTGMFTQYRSLLKEQGSTGTTVMCEDVQGNFWVGTIKSGLHLFDREKGISIKNFTEKDGLPNNWVVGILEDDSGDLWISTYNGLSKFNYSKGTFRNYSTSDGLEGMIFSDASAFKNRKGEMFFGGELGLNYFHPDSIKDDPVPPKVVIENISLFNRHGEKLTFEKYVAELDEIKLSYNQNDLRLDYVGLHFSEPTRNTYKYILEGFDESWIDAGTQRNATYTNLDPGEYIFKVTAANRDGVWNEKGASIKLIISPPFWATAWAYLFYTLLIISIIYFTWKLQLKRIKIKHDYEMSKFEADKMHEVDELKSRFFANISHEFRTPLTLIFGPAKDVLEETNEPNTKKNLGIIRRNATRLYNLVNQLLDLSKLESGKMKLEASEQDIIPMLKGIFLSFSSFAERKKIDLKFNTIEENLYVYIDKDKVGKIINNLLSNAFKFTPEGGKIAFTVEKLIDNVELRITDNGIGIPEERIEKIFDRFYQVDSSHTRQGEGTGIGLALTKELVELHRGKINVESKEGEGTTFTVQLPLGKAHLKPEEIVEKEIPGEAIEETEGMELITELENRKEKTHLDILLEEDKPLLLIVEDNSDVRRYIISHLEEDYRIQEAVDGKEGLNQAIEHIPDLIISDVMMPKMDGFELCKKLKTDERTSHIPVIMLTAKATSKDKIEGYETGADDYIMKPFDAKELKVRIKNLTEQRRKLREHFRQESLFVLDDKNITKTDKKFLKKAFEIIHAHLSDTSFGVDSFADEIAISRSQLHRKLIALVGEPPGDLIRRVRLTASAKLIKEDFGNISEIAAEVGFSNPANFAQCFRKQFGVSPSDYKNQPIT